MQKGTISVQSENIFPVIKKFLYSDHEIFLRELVSNAVDATTKLNILANRGEVKGEVGDITIEIDINEAEKTLTIKDRGIGMTEEEVLKYLNQIAFSSASEFLEQHKDSGIIGHFGLGFYSAFMVADKVEVVTKSYKDAPAVRWTCDGSPEYSIEEVEKAERGTEIILHINDENSEFLQNYKVGDLLSKYCKYLPVPIQFGTKKQSIPMGEPEEGEEVKEETFDVPNIINNVNPIWKKAAKDLTNEDYIDFYREQFPMAPDPMFWIHLNIDYPFNLTGVLYFPKIQHNVEPTRNKIHLYCNQVYVTDDVRNIVPEWLQLLHGVIDSPDIPLNVSRSYLQSDGNVKKINTYITKKVGDKLSELFKQDRKAFEGKWQDLGVFIKYGSVSDPSFQEKAATFSLMENTKGEFYTIEEYTEKIKGAQTDKNNKIVCLYTHDKEQHTALIKNATHRGYDVLLLNNILDNHWMQNLEYGAGKTETNFLFVRVDSDTLDNLVQKDEKRTSILSDDETNAIKLVFEKCLHGASSAKVEITALSPDDLPVTITRNEFMRRMKEMQSFQGMGMGNFPDSYQVIVNSNHPVIAQKLVAIKDAAHQEATARYLYDLALLQANMLKGDDLAEFVENSLKKI